MAQGLPESVNPSAAPQKDLYGGGMYYDRVFQRAASTYETNRD